MLPIFTDYKPRPPRYPLSQLALGQCPQPPPLPAGLTQGPPSSAACLGLLNVAKETPTDEQTDFDNFWVFSLSWTPNTADNLAPSPPRPQPLLPVLAAFSHPGHCHGPSTVTNYRTSCLQEEKGPIFSISFTSLSPSHSLGTSPSSPVWSQSPALCSRAPSLSPPGASITHFLLHSDPLPTLLCLLSIPGHWQLTLCLKTESNFLIMKIAPYSNPVFLNIWASGGPFPWKCRQNLACKEGFTVFIRLPWPKNDGYQLMSHNHFFHHPSH